MAHAKKIVNDSNRHREMGVCFVPFVIKDAKGCYIEDIAGKKYLDFNSQICTQNIGYGRPEIKRIIREYSKLGIYKIAGSDFYCEEALELAKKALSIAPSNMEKVFLVNSGAEAVENCIKLAYRKKGPYAGLSTKMAFHGRTLGALTYTESKEIQKRNYPELTNHIIEFCTEDDDPEIHELEDFLKKGVPAGVCHS